MEHLTRSWCGEVWRLGLCFAWGGAVMQGAMDTVSCQRNHPAHIEQQVWSPEGKVWLNFSRTAPFGPYLHINMVV